ncbi:hypothetical protein ACWDZ4_20640 [Streptomyces sp. NPDC003016]
MSNFRLDERENARAFALRIHDLETRLGALERTNQLVGASIEGDTLEVYDNDGDLRTTIGVQEDGTVGVVHHNAPPPPAPTEPVVAPVLAGLLVTWDGAWADAEFTPLDFTRVQVHIGASADFTPSPLTIAATISNPAGATVTVATETYATVYVRLVGVNAAEVLGAASAPVAGTPKMVNGPDLSELLNLAEWLKDASVPGSKLVAETIGANLLAANSVVAGKIDAAVITGREVKVQTLTGGHMQVGTLDATHIKAGSLTADRLAVGTDGNVIADPSFEGALSDQRAAGSTYWSITNGNGTARALRVNAANPTAVTRSMTLATLPAVPGQKVWLAIDYLASADWAGARVSFYAQWLDTAGAILGYSTITTGSNTVKGSWQRLSGTPAATAPTGTTQLRVACSTVDSTAGTVDYDNATCRIVLASGVAGARAEISPQGLQLFDDAGDEAVALMTGRPNYVTLSSDGLPVATIDQDGAAGFQRLAVADTLSIAGTDLLEHLNALPRGIQAIDYQVSTRTASASEMGFVELTCEIDTTRMYRFVFCARANPSAEGGELRVRLRDGGTGTPTINSPQRYVDVTPMPFGNSFTCRMEHVAAGINLGGGKHRYLVTFANDLGPAGQTCDMYGDSTSHGVFYIEDVGPYVPETGGYNDGGGTVTQPPTRYTKTYAATWSGSYANRGSYSSFYGSSCYQGYYSSTNGTQASLIGFSSALGTDLFGAVIQKAEVYLYFDHWHANAGGKAVIKAHSHTSRPSTFSSDAEAKTVSWSRNEGKWVDITSVFDSTRWRGIALDPNSTSTTYYGRARGYGQTNPPKLKVTYTR